MFGLGKAAHDILVQNSSFGTDGVGFLFDFLGERLGAGQAENVGDVVGLAPTHHLGAGIVAVAAKGDPGCWPMLSDASGQPAEMAADLDPTWRLARAKDDRDWAGAFGVIDVNGQETPLIVISVEQRELLRAMNDVASVVDIENDRIRFLLVAGDPLVDESVGQPHDILETRRILQA